MTEPRTSSSMKIEQPQCDRVVDPVAERNTACDVQSAPIVPPDCPHGESQLSPDVFFDELLKSFSIELNTPEAIQSRTSAFETRLSTLQTLVQRLEDLVSAVSTYRHYPVVLAQDLDIIIQTLQGTLDGENQDLWPDSAARGQLLQECRSSLGHLANVVDVLRTQGAVPVEPSELRAVSRLLEILLTDEANESLDGLTEKHWTEVELAAGGLDVLTQYVMAIMASNRLRASNQPYILATASADNRPVEDPKASPDFCSLTFGGKEYVFTPAQAGAFKALWIAWQSGARTISGATICEAAGGHSKRVRDIFKEKGTTMHLAWRTIIRKKGQNRYFLDFSEISRSST
jgi:hypothetical protein